MCPRNSSKNKTPAIGDIYLMAFDGVGSEQKGTRPSVVFQNNTGNEHSPNVIALPLTSSIKKLHLPTHVFLEASRYGLPLDSVVLCENPQRMSKSRLIKYVTKLDEKAMREIAEAHLLSTSAISFLSEHDLLRIWESSCRLNSVEGRCRS